ncbi:MAG TPA: DUF1667 domain-containing protein [Thermoplasmatales archaeon]|nr:DUF1667 domain-containing protein [Thermoplasmatales archaeon]
MSETAEVTCIMCPLGCRIKVTLDGENIRSIEGNACPNGEEYARQEIMSPSRILMSVIKCSDCDMPTVSVKTDRAIPKKLIWRVMRELRDIEVDPPVGAGDVIVENVLGTGANIVATRSAVKKK